MQTEFIPRSRRFASRTFGHGYQMREDMHGVTVEPVRRANLHRSRRVVSVAMPHEVVDFAGQGH